MPEHRILAFWARDTGRESRRDLRTQLHRWFWTSECLCGAPFSGRAITIKGAVLAAQADNEECGHSS